MPTLHVSYHLGEHYNSVRLASDPNLYNRPAIDFPIGHNLQEVDAPDLETTVSTKKESTLSKADPDFPTRDELISYASEISGLPDPVLMRKALYETFGNDHVPFGSANEMLQVIT